MNAVIPVWGHYSGLVPTLQCAIKHAGCPVHLVTEKPYHLGVFHAMSGFPFAQRIANQLLGVLTGAGAALHAYSIARWFVVREMITTKRITLPVYVFDWDTLIFANLAEAHEPFEKYDYAVSVEDPTADVPARTAPSYVNRLEPLNAFCTAVESLLRSNACSLKSGVLDDMLVWGILSELFLWNVGDTARVHNRSVFDHHLMAQLDVYIPGDIGKRIEWVQGRPHFIRREGIAVRANTLHCWGPFKGAESWLIKRSQME